MPTVDVAGERPNLGGLTEAAAFRVAVRTVLFTFGLVALIWLLIRLQTVVVQVFLALIIAASMTPIVNQATRPSPVVLGRRRWTPPRALVVLLLYLTLFLTIALLFSLLIPPLVMEIEDLVMRLPRYAADFRAFVEGLPERFPFLATFGLDRNLLSGLALGATEVATLTGQALAVVRIAVGVLGGALNGLFILFLALYMTVDSERILRYLISFLPPARQAQAHDVAARIGDRLGGWLRGQIMLSAIIGGLTLIGLLLLDVRYAVLLALIAAVGEAVPMVGPIVSAIPAVIIAFFQSPVKGVLTIVLYIIVQQLENNLVVPKVMERAVSLHPLVVMLALLAGAELMGIAGTILAVPLVAALAVIVDEVRRERMAGFHRQLELAAGDAGPAPVPAGKAEDDARRVPGEPCDLR
jgi:predicted PurR-regulated permease PerM